jgi:coenzyme F420 hydrogenase subunit beta
MRDNKLFKIVYSDLCIGCGACTALNPKGLEMVWNEYGFLVPQKKTEYEYRSEEKVCPFNIFPEKEVRTEDELANLFLNTSNRYDKEVGKFINTYVGYSNKFRMTSSSGGIATYVAEQLLEKKIVDAVAMVSATEDALNRFQFKLITDPNEIRKGSKTKYYPVSYSDVLKQIRIFDGRVAISGVGCFIKAIRLLQYYDPVFKDKIAFTIGIICGGIKSSFFSDYLAQKSGCKGNYRYPEFRVKSNNGNALDYSYSCIDNSTNETNVLRMKTVGDMWGTGYFKANACDFCDDVTTELADISLGDAWLPEYQKDDNGHNVIVTRSEIADEIIRNGIENGDLSVETLCLDRFLRSQRGSFNHRHKGLKYRVDRAKRKGFLVPPKRHANKKIGFLFKNVQRKRLQARSKSLSIWKDERNAVSFDDKCNKYRKSLKIATELYHIDRLPERALRKLKSTFNKV